MAVVERTLQGRLLDPDGTGARGHVEIEAVDGALRRVRVIRDESTGDLLTTDQRVELDGDGRWSVALPVTDGNTSPTGFGWRVMVVADGNNVAGPIVVELPAGDGTPVEFGRLLPADVAAEFASVVTFADFAALRDELAATVAALPAAQLVASYTVPVVNADPEGSAVQLVNTSAIGDLYRVTVPANTLQVGGRIRGVFSGRFYNDSGDNVTLQLMFPWGDGYAIVAGASHTLGTSGSPRMWRAEIEGVVIHDASANPNTQDADTRFVSMVHIGAPGPATTEQRPVLNTQIGKGLSVRNPTEDLGFGIQAKLSVASPLVRITLDFGYVDAIRSAPL